MNVNYSPDEVPELTQAVLNNAIAEGMHIAHIVCDASDGGEFSGASFIAATKFLPRRGDLVELQDGKECVVVRSVFRVTKNKAGFQLTPNVHCQLIEQPRKAPPAS